MSLYCFCQIGLVVFCFIFYTGSQLFWNGSTKTQVRTRWKLSGAICIILDNSSLPFDRMLQYLFVFIRDAKVLFALTSHASSLSALIIVVLNFLHCDISPQPSCSIFLHYIFSLFYMIKILDNCQFHMLIATGKWFSWFQIKYQTNKINYKFWQNITDYNIRIFGNALDYSPQFTAEANWIYSVPFCNNSVYRMYQYRFVGREQYAKFGE